MVESLLIETVFGGIILLIPAWRIFRRAGFPPALSLLVLVPAIGFIIAVAILAAGDWPAAAARPQGPRQ